MISNNIEMPVKRGTDKTGSFYRYGDQKKFYYKPNSVASRNIAKAKAELQGRAIKYSQNKK